MHGDERFDDPVPPQPVNASTPPARILLVDDSARDMNINFFALKGSGHQFEKTHSPSEARAIARDWKPDIILLDILMDEMDGISLAHQLREDGCDAELMFVTAFDDTETKVRGFDFAEQYLTKPFDPDEMLAMVGALLRRRRRSTRARPASQTPEPWMPVFDPNSNYVEVPGGKSNNLTRTERALLRALVEARGKIVSKRRLLWDIWHSDDTIYSVVEVYALRVRKKIEINPKQPELVMTAPGGYYYNVPV